MTKIDPTEAQTASACMSYRHDFGLMGEDQRKQLMWEAKEWLRAWQKELEAPTTIIAEAQARETALQVALDRLERAERTARTVTVIACIAVFVVVFAWVVLA